MGMPANQKTVRTCYEALQRQDTEATLGMLAEDVAWTEPEGLRRYGLGGTRVGRQGVRILLDRASELLVQPRPEPTEFFDTDDGVLVLGAYHVRSRDSRTTSVPFAHRWRLADGRVTHFEARYDTAELFTLLAGAEQPAPAAAPAGAAQDRFIQLGLGFWPARVLHSALEVGVYAELARGPADATTLAARLGLHERGARDFFDSQVALGLLGRENGQYRNTPEAARYLDPAQDTYIGGLLEMAGEHWYQSWGRLTTALRTGEPQHNIGGEGGDPFDALYADPERTRRFQKAMTGGSMAASQALARIFPWSEVSTVVDAGCSEGILLSTVLREHPHLTGIGMDLKQVEPTFAETVAATGLEGRLRFVAASFLTDPLPTGDVIVFGRVLHDWDLTTKRMLLEKAYAALPPGGTVLVYESMIDDDRRANAFGLLTSLHMLLESPGGFDYSPVDCIGWMTGAGFHDCAVQQLDGPVAMVVGHK